MSPEEFTRRKTGQLVRIAGTGEASHAFVPAPLPAEWEWPVEKWELLLRAHRALALLDGTGRHLPNPELVLRPLQNREAQKSSSLEGTITDPQQQMLFELDPALTEQQVEATNAHREVANYARALRLYRRADRAIPLSLRSIRRLHEVLMTGVRGGDRNPGEFRKLQNQVGRPARYVPPPPNLLMPLLDNLEKYLHEGKRFDPLVEAFVVHYQFEAIHPFMDGNGRVGRLMLALTIAEWCELADQWLYMSAYFDRNKDAYIDLLLKVSTHGAWAEWVDFCLHGVVAQATDTQRRCDELIGLNRTFHDRVNSVRGSTRLTSIVDGLFVRPATSVTAVMDRCSVTYPTARSDLTKLERLGIVARIENARQISYYAPAILDVIYADGPAASTARAPSARSSR